MKRVNRETLGYISVSTPADSGYEYASDFTDSVDRAMKALQSGYKVYRMDNLIQVKEIKADYTEVT